VKRGAKVLSTGTAKADAKALSHVAFRNPDGSHVLVVANPGQEKTVKVQAGGKGLEFKAPADSVHTLEWA
jgi:O-glycosyl hydrolase